MSLSQDRPWMADSWPINLEPQPFGRYIGRYMAGKSSVLAFLRSQRGAWTSPAEIRQVMAVPERTLRNWLRDLVEERLVEAHGERKGRQYRMREPSAETG